MSIPVMFGNEKFDLTAEQVTAMKKALGLNGKRLADVEISETFKVADIEFIKFSEENGSVIAVAKELLFNAKFGDDNNFAKSNVLRRLQTEILPKIEAAIGADNVLEFETDLLSLDGDDEYGIMKSKISLPTFDFYRKYVKIFDKYNVNNWWWLSTPDSTKAHNWTTTVRVVYYDGTLDCNYCDNSNGVRPFLIFSSNIFVS